MPRKLGALDRVREICLALPDTKETMTWGKPHFRVGEKIFAGCHEEDGKTVIGFKLTMPHAQAILADPRFSPAPYVGHRGWVSMDTTGVGDWDEVRALVLESYRLIAPKRTLKLLDGATPARAATARRPAAAKKPVAAKKPTRARPRRRTKSRA